MPRGENPSSLANLKRGGTIGIGRPKGLAQYVRQATKDGRTLTDRFQAIFEGRGLTVQQEDGTTATLKVTVDHVIEAGKWLADRGWGKATQAVELSGPDGGAIETRDADAAEFRSRVVGLVARVREERPALEAPKGDAGSAAS